LLANPDSEGDVREDANEAEAERRRGPGWRQQCLAAAMAVAVLLSGLNALVQVGKAAMEYGCRRGWLAAECRVPTDKR
jgi:hypothetical protein